MSAPSDAPRRMHSAASRTLPSSTPPKTSTRWFIDGSGEDVDGAAGGAGLRIPRAEHHVARRARARWRRRTSRRARASRTAWCRSADRNPAACAPARRASISACAVGIAPRDRPIGAASARTRIALHQHRAHRHLAGALPRRRAASRARRMKSMSLRRHVVNHRMGELLSD